VNGRHINRRSVTPAAARRALEQVRKLFSMTPAEIAHRRFERAKAEYTAATEALMRQEPGAAERADRALIYFNAALDALLLLSRRQIHDEPPVASIAAAWFRREDWPRWREIDPTIQPDFDVWLQGMEAAVDRYRAVDTPIVKTIILPDEFLAWTKATGHRVTTTARAEYAARKAMAQVATGTRV
jgi:hypothetical protein